MISYEKAFANNQKLVWQQNLSSFYCSYFLRSYDINAPSHGKTISTNPRIRIKLNHFSRGDSDAHIRILYFEKIHCLNNKNNTRVKYQRKIIYFTGGRATSLKSPKHFLCTLKSYQLCTRCIFSSRYSGT